MRSRWFWVGIGITAFLLALAIHNAHHNPVAQLEREIDRLKQRGEPTRFHDLLPPVNPSQDGTPFYQLAIAELETIQKQHPESFWDNLYQFGTKPVNLADVEKALKVVQPALKTFRQALHYPHMRMIDLEVDNPAKILFPHFSKFRVFALLLVKEALWRKRQGDEDGAVESCLTAMKLARRMGDEPTFIGFLVQARIFFVAVNALQRVLKDAEASPKVYRALLAELSAWDINRDLVRALQMERVFCLKFANWAMQKASLRDISWLSLHGEGVLVINPWLTSKNGFVARNMLELLDYLERLLSYARKGAPYDWAAIKRLTDEWLRKVETSQRVLLEVPVKIVWHPYAVAKLVAPIMYPGSFYKAAESYAFQRLGQVAVALRIYRQEHGRYPEDLRALVPLYLPQVPLDPFDGKELRYRRLGQGFKVWSVGFDCKDDGGMEGKPTSFMGDIVWTASR